MAKPRALLTGRSGFTGRYVAHELERAGFEVFGLSNYEIGNEPRSVRVDLLDREAVRRAIDCVKPDVVLHLAAIAFVAHDDIEQMYRVNVVGTRNLLEALASSSKSPEIVILASSANIYGNATVTPVSEETPPAPANDYAVSKLAMEYMARLWMHKLPIVIARPFNYTGVGQPEQFLVPKIVSHFRHGRGAIELGNTDVVRDFSDVRDVAKMYLELIRCKPLGQIVNICSGVGTSLKRILAVLSNLAGYEIEVTTNPRFVREGEIHRLVGTTGLDCLANITRHSLEETIGWMFLGDMGSGRYE